MTPTVRCRIRVALLLVSLCLAGCQTAAGPQGQSQLLLAQQQFDAGSYVLAIQTLERFLQDYGNSREAARAHYLRGLSYRRLGPAKDPQAEADFQEAIRRGNDDQVVALARVALGHLYYEMGQANQLRALEHYEQALAALPEAPPKDMVFFRTAVLLQNQGRWQEADAYLSRCFARFPESEVAGDARQRFGARQFTLQAGAFGNLAAAEALCSKLESAGWPAQWHGVQRDGRLLYAVQTGAYPDLAAAEAALARLQAVHADAFIAAVRS